MSAWLAKLFARRAAWSALWVEIRVMARTEPALEAFIAGRISYAEYRSEVTSALVAIIAGDAVAEMCALAGEGLA